MRKRTDAMKKMMGEQQTSFAEREVDLLAGLNPEQVEVVNHGEGPCRVLALAGSGKTESLARRIARLIRSGVDPKRILAVTFSTKGAEEMNGRIKRKYGIEGGRIGTWHSICLQILREDRTEEGSWNVQGEKTGKGPGTTTNPKAVLKDVLGYKGMNWVGADTNAVTSFIGRCKANLFEPGSDGSIELGKKEFGWQANRAIEAFRRYNDELAARALLTFDDFLVFAARHLASDEQVRASWAGRWDYVIQDEAQDMNRAQRTIANLLARDHGNYMAIGDLFQAIYGFRGSTPEHLAGFETEWPGARTIVLPRNYRSGREIISAANRIVGRATIVGVDAPTEMIGERDSAGEVRVLESEAIDDEASHLADAIQKSVQVGDSKLSDHTVLYRLNAQSRGVEEALLSRRIPYIVVGGVSFYERKEIRDLLAYLRLTSGRGAADDIKRSINTPFRYLGAKFVERVMRAAADLGEDRSIDWAGLVEDVADGERLWDKQRASAREWAGLLRVIRERADLVASKPVEELTEQQRAEGSPSNVLDYVVRQTRYIDYLNKEEGSENTEDSNAANVREMIRVAERFPTVIELLDYVDETIKSAKKQREDKQAGGERVLLMSIHRSKGLEWPHVYVVGMNEMVLPHVKGDPEEERRLAYVAATRARDVLTLSYVRRFATRAGIKLVEPSRFLLDVKSDLAAPASHQSVESMA